MKTLFFLHHQNLLLDASAIFQNPVLLCLILGFVVLLSFKSAMAYERYNRYRSINNLFDNIGGGHQPRPTSRNELATDHVSPRKKGMPGWLLSGIVAIGGVAAMQSFQSAPADRQALQANYQESDNQSASSLSDDTARATAVNDAYHNKSPHEIVESKKTTVDTYSSGDDFIPRPVSETKDIPEDYTVQKASLYTTVSSNDTYTKKVNKTPLYTIQVSSASDHHHVRSKAYDYSQDFPRIDVFTYQQGGITKLFLGQYYSEKEMRQALQQLRQELNSSAFPVDLQTIDQQLLAPTS